MNTANSILDDLYFITTTVVDWVDTFFARSTSTLFWSSWHIASSRKG